MVAGTEVVVGTACEEVVGGTPVVESGRVVDGEADDDGIALDVTGEVVDDGSPVEGGNVEANGG